MALEFRTFERTPFEIQAVQITENNIEEVANLIGTVRRNGKGTKYIEVNPQKVPSVSYVYKGWWVTKVNNQYRCYKSKIFKEHFQEKN